MTRGPAELHPQLVALAAAQGGVFTAEQARSAGVGPGELGVLRRHVLTPVRRGVYAIKGVYDSLDTLDRYRVQVAALQLALSAPAVFSHETAAVLHDLAMLQPELDLLHVTRPGLAASREEAGVHHHAAAVPAHHLVSVDGRPLTSIARTAVDVARETRRLECAVAILDSALRAGVSPDELLEAFLLCRSWPGARLAARALPMADGRADNPGESWSRTIFIAYGIAPSDIQQKVYDEDGMIGISDFTWEAWRLIGEFDGRLKYRVAPGMDPEEAGRVVWLEKRREDRFRAMGYGVVRWGHADLFQPARLVARVRAAGALQVRRGRPAG